MSFTPSKFKNWKLRQRKNKIRKSSKARFFWDLPWEVIKSLPVTHFRNQHITETMNISIISMGYFLIQSKFSNSHYVFSWSVEVFSMLVIHACTAHLAAHPEFPCSSWKKFSNCYSWWFRPNLRDLGKNSLVERWKILVSATVS